MNIKITIDAPELAKAIESLAVALNGAGSLVPNNITPPNEPAVDGLIPVKEADSKAEEAKRKAKHAETVAKAKAKKEADEKKKATEAKAKKEAEEKAEEESKSESETAPVISLEVVRGKLAEHASKGKPQQEEVKAAITELGAAKLTEVKAEDYGKLLELVGVSS